MFIPKECPTCDLRWKRIVELEAECDRLREKYIDLENLCGIPSMRARLAKIFHDADEKDQNAENDRAI